MKRYLLDTVLVLAVAIFAALGCSASKNGEATTNTTINSVNTTTVTNTTATNSAADSTSSAKMPPSKAIAWELGNKLSLAAVLYDLKGTETSDSLSKAKVLANEVGAEVPSFPAKTGDKIKDSAAIIAYLLNDTSKNIGAKINSKYGSAEAALFEMSLKSNTLLLIYGPGDSTGTAVAKMIRTNAKTADLPENLWLPLVSKIESKGSFDDVKDAVLEMQSNVGQYLNK